MARRLAAGLVVAALATAGCSHAAGERSPRTVALPRLLPGDPALIRAGKLAQYVERRWPRVTVQEVRSDRKGTVVQFQDQARFDSTITDSDAYVADVRKVTADLVQASVALLKLSMRYFPHLQYASVWQDSQLKAFWSKEGIDAMASPSQYRSYTAFLKLVMTAQFPPMGTEPPPAPTS